MIVTMDFSAEFSPGSTEINVVDTILATLDARVIHATSGPIEARWKSGAGSYRRVGNALSAGMALLEELRQWSEERPEIVTCGGWRSLLLGAVAGALGAKWTVVLWDSPLGTRCDAPGRPPKVRPRFALASALLSRANAVGLFIHEALLQELGVTGPVVKYFGNGVAVDVLSRIRQATTPMPEPAVCYVGLLSRKKGAAELLEAMRLVKREVPSVTLLHIGGIAAEDREWLKRADKKCPQAERMASAGDWPYEVAMGLAARCTVGVVPYPDVHSLRWNEVLKAREYVLLGLKVVAFSSPGVERALSGVTGVRLVRHGDVRGMADAILASLETSAKGNDGIADGNEVSASADWKRRKREVARWLERSVEA